MPHAEDCTTNIHDCYMICYLIHVEPYYDVNPPEFLLWATGKSEPGTFDEFRNDWNSIHGRYLRLEWDYFSIMSHLRLALHHWKGWPENEMCYNELVEYKRLKTRRRMV